MIDPSPKEPRNLVTVCRNYMLKQQKISEHLRHTLFKLDSIFRKAGKSFARVSIRRIKRKGKCQPSFLTGNRARKTIQIGGYPTPNTHRYQATTQLGQPTQLNYQTTQLRQQGQKVLSTPSDAHLVTELPATTKLRQKQRSVPSRTKHTQQTKLHPGPGSPRQLLPQARWIGTSTAEPLWNYSLDLRGPELSPSSGVRWNNRATPQPHHHLAIAKISAVPRALNKKLQRYHKKTLAISSPCRFGTSTGTSPSPSLLCRTATTPPTPTPPLSMASHYPSPKPPGPATRSPNRTTTAPLEPPLGNRQSRRHDATASTKLATAGHATTALPTPNCNRQSRWDTPRWRHQGGERRPKAPPSSCR
jgi:hypothetical protein